MGADGTTVSRLETELTRTDHDERMTTMMGTSQPTPRLRRPSANAYDIELLQSLPRDGSRAGEGTVGGGTTDIAAKGGIDVEDLLLGPGEGGKAKDPIERLDAVGIGEILDDDGKLKPDEAFQPATDAGALLSVGPGPFCSVQATFVSADTASRGQTRISPAGNRRRESNSSSSSSPSCSSRFSSVSTTRSSQRRPLRSQTTFQL